MRLVRSVDNASEKKLFTPGPLSVSFKTKRAMLQDLGSRERSFVSVVKHVRQALVELANVSNDEFTCVPMQGSGTFAIESVLTSTVPCNGKVPSITTKYNHTFDNYRTCIILLFKILILENGAYGRRQEKMCQVIGIPNKVLSFPENEFVCPQKVLEFLR